MEKVFDLVLFRVIYTPLFCCIIHIILAIEASRIIKGVTCRSGEYYSVPAEACISCHVPCDNAIMKKSQDVCNIFCPDFAKPPEHNPEVRTGSMHSDLSWVAGPVVGGVLTLILLVVLVIYCRKHSRFVIGKQYRGSRGQRYVADPVHDPDNLEWQEQQHRAAQDKRCLHQPAIDINQHEEKEFSMDRQKALVANL